MRPVLLQMEGFASFRERAEVRFDDTDYFVLVGSTGAGKSTVIDAMTFALYGTVARWEHETKVQSALAATVNRGVVRLVFDVGGARYSVVREVRRSRGKNAGVSVRSVRLERFAEPTAVGDAEDETEVLASDGEVTAAVERLLGLNFKHFCACVALPQGEFAKFLRAKAGDRQEILVKLLGWEVYKKIAQSAGTRATDQRQRADVLSGRLGAYTEVTEAAVELLAARVGVLEKLTDRVDSALPEMAAVATEHDAAQGQVRTLEAERAHLTGIEVPAEVAGLHRDLRAALTVQTAAKTACDAAQKADDVARAELRNAPDRSALEETRRRWAELAETTSALPELQSLQEISAEVVRGKDEHVAQATVKAGLALEHRDAAGRTAAETAAQVLGVRREHDLLAAVEAPADLAAVVAAGEQARDLTAAAELRVAAAERADAEARAAVAGLPSASSLSEVLNHARTVRDICTAQLADVPRLATQQADLARVTAEHDAAVKVLAEAEQAVAAAEVANRAAVLREQLVPGEPCPVCDQDVHTVPPPHEVASLTAARADRAAATRGQEGAAEVLRRLQSVVERTLDTRAAELAKARQVLAVIDADVPLTDDVLGEVVHRASAIVTRFEADLNVRAKAEQRVTDLHRELTEAREEREAAHQATADVSTALDVMRTTLRRHRDPLVTLGAPHLDEADVRTAWDQFTAWVGDALAARAADLPVLSESAASAQSVHEAAEQALTVASADLEMCQKLAVEAKLSLQGLTTQLDERGKRRAELERLLDGAQPAMDVERELARIAILENTVERTHSGLTEARAHLGTADTAVREVDQVVARARQGLGRARDPLAALGAPELDPSDLHTAWTSLVQWAQEKAEQSAARLDTATAAVNDTRTLLDRLEQELTTDLQAAEVSAGQPVGEKAAVAVATALTQARSEHRRMAERLAERAGLRADIRDAEEQSQVARLLADHLRSDKFQRWLVDSAIDTLVKEASALLFELSGGQFDLTYSKSEFHVVDHNEADADRPVKTLSGGETFQASLALALALSSQMGALAAEGAARLDSIFLDEGFGTLDEDTLDTVASTLENLANSGSRMVGIITHVGALAERVPVRFRVVRDAASSRIVRESL
ncbi:SMC family ATPase [Lentzea sp. NPDC003310]|uniref:SMC family ATPase n=1 Tax=Lentzea sp. NPDC003310 TaxID=3154447 RepID=UPI0033B6BCC3